MDCERIRDVLVETAGEPVPAALRASLDAHVAGCAACARFRDTLARVDRGLSRHLTPAPALDRQFRARLRARIDAAPRRVWVDWLPAAVHFASCGVATAACVALVPASATTIVAAAAGITLVSHFLLGAAQNALDAANERFS